VCIVDTGDVRDCLGEKEVVWEEGEGWGVEREQRMG
jgi:hypothetical protein